jgi:hypothetical protein
MSMSRTKAAIRMVFVPVSFVFVSFVLAKGM